MDQSLIVINELFKTDGHKADNRLIYTTIDKSNADIIQELCIKNNMSCTITLQKQNPKAFGKKDMHLLVITKTVEKIPSTIVKISTIDYNDIVYCVKMPKDTIISRLDGKVAFTGNCWDLIEERVGRHGKSPIEIEPNIFYCPIGSTLDINGTVIMFVGGADSIDKRYRTPRLSWWAQEVLTDEDYDYIVSTVERADIIVSHTCPNLFDVREQLYYDKGYDPSRYILDKVYAKYKPKYWFFGHWHRFIKNSYENTEWYAIDMIGNKNWYRFCSIINTKEN